MQKLFLIKYGEISLKGKNKQQFINRLKVNIKRKLKGIPTEIRHLPGRFYLNVAEANKQQVAEVLARTFGIVSFAEAWKLPKAMEAIEAATRELAADYRRTEPGKRFKIDCRRTDKKFPLDSYQISCRLGSLVLELHPELEVNLNHPDWTIRLEIREYAYLYGRERPGLGGLPTGCAGRGLLLLSGGIDSPVAGYLMGKRGLNVDAIYFHTHPFTSEKTLEKVKQLGHILSAYFANMHLYQVPFTDLQVRIKEEAHSAEVTLHSRACMMQIADRIACHHDYLCLITGESLSQVASQTAQSIRYTQSAVNLPVFRPLIGLDKEEIITVARKIGTYETSIQPHPDCCTLFAPDHPLIKPEFAQISAAFTELGLEELLAETVAKTECLPLQE